jgi:hypothetical protein
MASTSSAPRHLLAYLTGALVVGVCGWFTYAKPGR